MLDMHPFWRGFYSEVEKVGFVDPDTAKQYALEHPIVAASAVGVPLGLGVIAAKRAISKRMNTPKVPAGEAAKVTKGFGMKGLALAGGAGLLGGYMLSKKHRDEE